MPDRDEVSKRLVAARTVRGLSQKELGAALYKAGGGDFGKEDVARLERGDLPLGPARRRALADVLEIPESWFTDENPFGSDAHDELDEIRQRQEQLAADVATLREATLEILMLFRRNPPANVRQRKARAAASGS